jgi:hypothetical protein
MADIEYRKLPATAETHKRYDQFAERWRMTLTDAVEFAIENLERLSREEVASRIERRPAARRARKATVASA